MFSLLSITTGGVCHPKAGGGGRRAGATYSEVGFEDMGPPYLQLPSSLAIPGQLLPPVIHYAHVHEEMRSALALPVEQLLLFAQRPLTALHPEPWVELQVCDECHGIYTVMSTSNLVQDLFSSMRRAHGVGACCHATFIFWPCYCQCHAILLCPED